MQQLVFAFLLLMLPVLTVFSAPQGAEDSGTFPTNPDLLGQIRDVLEEAESPLSAAQTRALIPILETAPIETAQRGAGLSEQLRGRAGQVLTDEQTSALRRAEAGRLLLEDGVEGLRATLATSGAPPLTFDQETQVRSVYEAHVRALEDLLAGSQGDRTGVRAEIRDLEDQLLLAALKFLNPVQRTALAGSLTAAEFAELNNDLPEDEDELREYLSDLRSPAGGDPGGNFGGGRGGRRGHGGGLTIDGFSGGRMPNRDEIQEIRINENSFSAENGNQSRGQTEIITRGGTGRFNGDTTFNFSDEALDARNAFAESRPFYQRRNFSANVSGPVVRNRLTLTFSMRKNNGEDGDNLLANTPEGLRSDAISKPQSSYNYTTRATAQLAGDHVLNTSVTFGSFRSENQGVGGEGLPEQGSIADRGDFNFQVKETAILSRTFNNEVRFRVGRNTSKNIPLTEAPHIDVTGAFQSGGSTQNSETTRKNWEFGNLLMYTGNAWALRIGFDGRYRTESWFYKNNFNGTYRFDSLEDFIAKTPSQYEVTLGNPVIDASQFETAAYLQSDWRARNDLTLSFGVRYEDQTNLADHNNLDPRIGFAYSIAPNVVVRGGTGIFHDRFNLQLLVGAKRVDGELQRNVEIKNPIYDPDNPFLTGDVEDSIPSVRRLSEDLATPYTWNSEASVETSFNSGLVLTGSYRFIRGVHLYRARNVNAPFDADAQTIRSCVAATVNCVIPDPNFGKIAVLESSGTSTNHNVRVGIRQRFSFVNLNGSYNFNSEYDDVAGNYFTLPSDNYNLDAEWGRSGRRHSVDASVNWRLPLNVNANTQLNWSSGSPYTLRTGTDDNHDGEFNDRPLGVPRNSLDGPGFFEVDLNLSKSIQLRSDRVELGEASGGTGPVAGGGYYGQRTGVRMTITADIENLLNKVNYNRINGVQTSSFFGRPTSARDGRRINLSVRFNF